MLVNVHFSRKKILKNTCVNAPKSHSFLSITSALLNFIFCKLVILNLLIKSFLSSIGFTMPSLIVLHSSGATSFERRVIRPLPLYARGPFGIVRWPDRIMAVLLLDVVELYDEDDDLVDIWEGW